jgi:hypothetical protein
MKEENVWHWNKKSINQDDMYLKNKFKVEFYNMYIGTHIRWGQHSALYTNSWIFSKYHEISTYLHKQEVSK